jgi:hypothetical protein
MNRDLVTRILDRAHACISSARFEGAAVYNLQNERVGTMHSVMIDKKSGRVAYVVMLLDGTVSHAHPLPWAMLHYDPDLPGYRSDLSHAVLKNAPRFTLDDDGRPHEISGDDVARYYGVGDEAIPLPLEDNDFNARTV